MTARRHLASIAAVLMCGTGISAAAIDASQAQQSQAVYAYVTSNLNQRAGPATRYPSLGVVPARSQVTVNGCLQDLSWCEGTVGDVRGWMSASYLRLYDYGQQAWVEVDDYAASTRLARYTFNLENYWAANYRNRPFYPQRASWVAPPRSPTVDNAVFYRELSPYGRWTSLDGSYVWMPQVSAGWRPYTDGRWEYTERYGWTWVSNEPFGWATYHYGRWAYSNRLGWVWVPGTQWAPAWVAWRGSEDHLAWAPLPPDAGPGFRPDDGYDEIPSYYWQVVPSQDFLLPNLINAVLGNDNRDRRGYLDRARPIGSSTVVNNVVVNNVINVKYVEEKTRKRVVPREVVITNREDNRRTAAASESDQVVRIYQPSATEEAPATATPPKVLPAEIAARQSQTTGQEGDEQATENRVAEAPVADEAAPPTEAPPLAPEEVEAEAAAEQPAAPPADDGAAPAVQPPSTEQAPPQDATTAEPPPADLAPPSGDVPAPPTDVAPAPPSDESAPPATPEDAAPPMTDEAAPPPPPADEAAPPPPPADEAAPPPPPPVEEAAPPPLAEEAAPPPPPPVEEAAPPPPPPVEEAAPPPPPAEEAAPPPPPAEEAAPPPPPAEEAAPPPPPPAEEAAPPPPPVEEAAPPPPPPAEEAAPPPPPPVEEAAPPPPPPVEEAAPPPPPAAKAAPPPEAPPAVAVEPSGKDRQKAKDCPDGKRLNNKNECVPRKK